MTRTLILLSTLLLVLLLAFLTVRVLLSDGVSALVVLSLLLLALLGVAALGALTARPPDE